MIKFSRFFPVFSWVLITLMTPACSNNPKDRPSPPRADSTIINNGKIKIEYSSPGVKDRKIWGGLVTYDEIWRTGANEATVFTTQNKIKINGFDLDAGKYALFTIPTQKEWTIIFNSEWNQWGVYHYDSLQNVLTFQIEPEKTDDFAERMLFNFEKNKLKFHWEKLTFSLSLE